MLNNIDPDEIAKFERLAAHWWNPAGALKPLHDINPLRLQFIQTHKALMGQKALDIGCGGGILTESLAKQGAITTGIDMSEAALNAARLHQTQNQLNITYQHITAEELAAQAPASFDIVTCMELLEHVPDPASLVMACARLVKPGGAVFFSTLNRNLKTYLYAIVGAEYIFNILPKGTHDYAKFIRPAELASWARNAGLNLQEFAGINYSVFSRQYQLSSDTNINYLTYCQREN